MSGHHPRVLGGGRFHFINRGRGRAVDFHAVADRPAFERSFGGLHFRNGLYEIAVS